MTRNIEHLPSHFQRDLFLKSTAFGSVLQSADQLFSCQYNQSLSKITLEQLGIRDLGSANSQHACAMIY